jgi:8-oxo-dGTP diphosphatase
MTEEKTYYGDAVVYLSFIPAKELERIANKTVTSVHCFPIKDDTIMFTENPRGIDIIGGHVEKGESPEEAMHREAMEEGYLTIKSMNLIGAVRVDNRDNPKAIESGYPAVGYQLFYAVTDFNAQEFKANFECTGRIYLNLDKIPERHHKWLNTHTEILNEMKSILKPVKKIKSKI